MFQLLLCLWLEVMDPGLIHNHKSLKKTVGICINILQDFPSPFEIGSKFWGTTCRHLGHMKFVVDDCMNVVLGDTQLSGDDILVCLP